MRDRAILRLCCTSLLAAANLAHAQDNLTVVSAASSLSTVAPGGLGTIYGQFSASPTIGTLNTLGLFPTQLAGFAVDFNGLGAQLLYVGPQQINFVVPAGVGFGSTSMNLMGTSGPIKTMAIVQPVAPAIFTQIQGGREIGAILNAVTFQGPPFNAETSSIPGCDTRTRLAVFATGLGLATSRAKARDVRAELVDATGSLVPADVQAAVAAPGFMGLDQVNIVLPSTLRSGTVRLRLIVNGLASNEVQFDLAPRTAAAASSACLGDVSISRSMAPGGQFQGTVSLAYPSAGEVTVNLSADGGVTVPATVTVPAGKTSMTFPVAIGANAPSVFNVNASLNGVAHSAEFRQGPACVNGMGLSSEGIVAGYGLKGTVMLSDPAPAEGLQVELLATNPIVSVSPSVTIPAGQLSAQFDVTTATAVAPSKALITAAGKCGGTSSALNLVIVPCVSGVSLAQSTVAGGGRFTGTVKLNAPALSGGVLVNLASSDPSVTVDSQVQIPEGQTTGTFNVTAGAVNAKTVTSVTATVSNCGSAAAALTLMPM
jgi:uncharacterized protein (TIGR03437 family)